MTLLISRKGTKEPEATQLRQVELWANAYNKITPTYASGYSSLTGTNFYVVVDPFGWVNFEGDISYSGPNIGAGTFSTMFTLPGILPFVTSSGDRFMSCTFGYGLGVTAASYVKATTVFGVVGIEIYVPVANTAFNVLCSGARYHS